MAVIYALTASIAWGTSDFLGAIGARRAPLPWVLAGSQVVGGLLTAPAVVVWAGDLPHSGRLWLGVAAGAIAVAELGLIYLALSRGPALVMAPIAALSALVPVSVGLAGGDTFDLLIGTGVVCCLAGAAGASWSPGGARASGRQALVAIAISGGAAVGAGAVLTLIDLSSAASGWWTIAAVRAGGAVTSLTLLGAFLLRMRTTATRPMQWLRRVRTQSPLLVIAGVGLTDAGADVAYVTATNHGALTIVSVVASLYPVTTIALGALLLRERPARLQLAAATVALTGVALLAVAGTPV